VENVTNCDFWCGQTDFRSTRGYGRLGPARAVAPLPCVGAEPGVPSLAPVEVTAVDWETSTKHCSVPDRT
jgi:hypothetical protein